MKHQFYRRGKLVEAVEVEAKVIKLPRSPDFHRVPVPSDVRESFATLREARLVPDIESHELSAINNSNWAVLRTNTWEAIESLIPADIDAHVTMVRDSDGEIAGINNTLVVRFDSSMTSDECSAFILARGMQEVRKLNFAINLYVVRTNDGTLATEKSYELHQRHEASIVYAEPVLTKFGDPRHRPNDEFYKYQWQWANLGGEFGKAGADVRAEAAWDQTKGNGTRIAIIDRGFHHRHRDLSPNIHSLSGHFGDDFMFSNDLLGLPNFSHGSFCAAQAAAVADDGYGTCGIAPEAKLVLIGLSDLSAVTQTELACAIAYAAVPSSILDGAEDRGADVVSCAEGAKSGKSQLESVLEDALLLARNRGRNGLGMPIFWAVANREIAIEEDEALSHRSIIRVGSSDAWDKVAVPCAFGSLLDFLAPGDNVVNVEGNYFDHGPDSGTSFATPIAAGIAGLMLSIAPGLTVDEVRRLMRESCRKVGDLSASNPWDDRYGHGIVNAAKAVELAQTWVDAG